MEKELIDGIDWTEETTIRFLGMLDLAVVLAMFLPLLIPIWGGML